MFSQNIKLPLSLDSSGKSFFLNENSAGVS